MITKNIRTLAIILMMTLLVSPKLWSRENPGSNSPGLQYSPKLLEDNPERTLLNIGNWGYWMRDNGESAHTPGGNSGGIYPRSTAAAIYLDGVLVGGYQNDLLKVSGQIYTTGTVQGYIQNGQIMTDGVRIYRIRKGWETLTLAQVRQDASDFYEKSLGSVSDADAQSILDQYEKDWNEWPTGIGAPFYDLDSDGVYEPADGETPGVANADQIIWYVINDNDPTTTADLYGTDPIGLEMQMTLWGYNQPGASLGQIVFKQIRLINKGGGDLTDAYISLWSDPDVGNYTNDLVGVDTTLSMMFAYNGETTDSDYEAYGLAPPAVGYDFFAGPAVASDSCFTEAEGAGSEGTWGPCTAIINLEERSGYRNLPASSFGYFVAGGEYSDPGPYGSVEAAREYYNLMRGYAPIDDLVNPTPWIDDTGDTTLFPFAGDPVTGEGHLDSGPADRRMLINSGPFTLAVGDTQDIVTSIVGGLGDSQLSSITALKNTDLVAQLLFDDLFQSVPSAPPAPNVNVVALDNNVVLDWGSDQTRVSSTEGTMVAGYAFQGYNVYQLPSATASKDNSVLIETYDIVDGTLTIYGNIFLPEYGEVVNVPVQFGLDKGIKRTFTVDHDYITGGPLYTGSEYYFAVSAYNYNATPNLIEDKALESSLTPLFVKLTPSPVGTSYGADAGTSLEVSHTGPSQGVVSAIVVDPSGLTGHDYNVSFRDNAEYVSGTDTTLMTLYDIIDVTDNDTLLMSQKQASSQSDFDQPIVDGLQFVVSGPELGIVAIEEYDENGNLVDGTVDSHLNPSLSQTALVFDNRAGAINQPAYARDYDRFDYWGMDDVIFDFSKTSLTWDYLSEEIHIDAETTLPDYAPFAVYRITFPAGDTLRLFAGFWDSNADGKWSVNGTDDWETPTFGAASWEPIYCWQGYDADGNEISYDPANEAQYIADSWLGSATTANTTWGGGAGAFHYPYITATMIGAYYGCLDNGDCVSGDPGGGVSALPIAGSYDKNGVMLTVSHYFKFTTAKANSSSDVFTFTAPATVTSDAIAMVDIEKVNVFPNPYYAFNSLEENRFDKFVTFTHLPAQATIKIFTLNGNIVRTLKKDTDASDVYLKWDLRNEKNLPVASGPYVAHIDMGTLGEKLLKLYIIQRNQVIQYY